MSSGQAVEISPMTPNRIRRLRGLLRRYTDYTSCPCGLVGLQNGWRIAEEVP